MRRTRRAIGHEALERWVFSAQNNGTFARRFRWANTLWRKPITINAAEDDDLLRIGEVGTSSGEGVSVARISRVRIFLKGLDHRRSRLARDYMIDRIPISDGDFIVDVGANIGEFSLLVARRAAVRGVAIEPEALEYRALQENLAPTGVRAVHALLWSKEDRVPFFSNNQTGDSSVFRPQVAHRGDVELRRTVTLDALLSEHLATGRRIRVLKLEAEGAEPEILLGARRTLEATDFVTADLGPERGPDGATTLVAVCNLLDGHGFRPLDFSHHRISMLFARV